MEKILYKLEDFEGPLDLLLHLIHKNKLDIKDIKIEILLEQYMQHLNQMEKLGIEIKSEFLNMISRLIYIKSLSLLPKNEEEKTMKDELSSELIEHQNLKFMVEIISENINFGSFVRTQTSFVPQKDFCGKIDVNKFIKCYLDVQKSQNLTPQKLDSKIETITSKKIVSVKYISISILKKLKNLGSFSYFSLFKKGMSRSVIVATFLAILELIKIKKIKIKEWIIKIF